MKFYVLSEKYKKNKNPTCEFMLFEGMKEKPCGEKAHGSLGKNITRLCKHHFEYARALYGESDVEPQVLHDETE